MRGRVAAPRMTIQRSPNQNQVLTGTNQKGVAVLWNWYWWGGRLHSQAFPGYLGCIHTVWMWTVITKSNALFMFEGNRLPW